MKRLLLLLCALALSGCGRDEPEIRTYDLRYLDAEAGWDLIQPYLDGMSNASRTTDPPALTLRGPVERLEQIEQVLARYDRPLGVQLRFQLIEADGFTGSDSAIADVEGVLRDLFRFAGYRLAAEALVQAQARGRVRQQLRLPDGTPVLLSAGIDRILSSEQGSAVSLEVSLSIGNAGEILATSLIVPSGRTAVVGSARASERNTLILVVRPEVQ